MNDINSKIQEYDSDIEKHKRAILNLNIAIDQLAYAVKAANISNNISDFKKRIGTVPLSLQKHIFENQKDLNGCKKKIGAMIRQLISDRRIVVTIKKRLEKKSIKLKVKRIKKSGNTKINKIKVK
jgi:hypothetical protein